jgi:hypothetical protein
LFLAPAVAETHATLIRRPASNACRRQVIYTCV